MKYILIWVMTFNTQPVTVNSGSSGPYATEAECLQVKEGYSTLFYEMVFIKVDKGDTRFLCVPVGGK